MKRKLVDDIADDVLDAIQQLPDMYSEAVLLFCAGLSYNDIADQKGFTRANAWMRVRKARRLIYQKLIRLNPDKYASLLK